MSLPREQVDALAPDDASRKAGRQLAAPSRWLGAHSDGNAAWGECSGSGKTPYGVMADASRSRWKCTCPSRKQPCKHVLALLYLLAAGETTPSHPPADVAAWIDKTPTTKPVGPVSETTKAKRLDSVADGIAALEQYLILVSEKGLVSVGAEERSAVAKRLVDSKAAGLASELRQAARSGPQAVDEHARLWLICRLWHRRGRLPAALRAELDGLVGLVSEAQPAREETTWWSPGSERGIRDRLAWRRTWICSGTGQVVYQLDWGPTAPPPPIPTGVWVSATLTAPDGIAARAKLAEAEPFAPVAPAAGSTLEAMAELLSAALAANPLIPAVAFPVEGSVVADPWMLRDLLGEAVALSGPAWDAYAHTYHDTRTFWVAWNGRQATILSWSDGGTWHPASS